MLLKVMTVKYPVLNDENEVHFIRYSEQCDVATEMIPPLQGTNSISERLSGVPSLAYSQDLNPTTLIPGHRFETLGALLALPVTMSSFTEI